MIFFSGSSTSVAAMNRTSPRRRVISRAISTIRAASASDALAAHIVETAREITRLRGEVRFIAATEIEEPEKKIIDKRKWD